LLGAAARKIGNARVRGRGTLGGSLAHSDPAAELPLVMVALGAVYEITDGHRSREVKAEEFHLGFLTTALAPDELVVAARVPRLGPGWGWSFLEVSRRDGDFALAAAAALVRIAGGVIVESRVAVGGVGDRPIRLADVEISLTGATVSQIGDRIGQAGPIQGIRPVSDTSASAGYRARLCRVLVARALAEAGRRSEEAA
jgi:aerobic carbon-monoxide dehydrogenase medium subunit